MSSSAAKIMQCTLDEQAIRLEIRRIAHAPSKRGDTRSPLLDLRLA